MSANRQRVLAAILAALGLLASAVLFDVLGTVFFAITVAYVLTPLHEELVDRGIPPWWASAAATGVAFVGVVALFASFVFLIYRRQTELLAVLRDFPDSVTVEVLGMVYSADASILTGFLRENLTDVALRVARAAPVLALKVTLFALVVFALLLRREQARKALLAPVPHEYRPVASAFHERTRATLFAIYVLQAATAFATFLVALPVFSLLGYDLFVTLALLSGFLQFLPIVGPSVLVAALAAYQVSVGDVTAAVLVGVLGAVLVGWLPDAVIRTRLARQTAGLPGSLYFVGFTGGLLSLGPVGFIAGPLVVALLVEAADMLAAEVNGNGKGDGSEIDGANGGDHGGGRSGGDHEARDAGSEDGETTGKGKPSKTRR
ncbi:AI-2E family transporter [Halorussus salilacus]|uniref:AI-2E family transporter n=1 Tax=Halorussus salilacus TaxID=2953750 RepID=UPI0020A177B4|nr:AI-2E family transporter [Halorussus salilacus]USZ67052.1 AI-2E family transporter [Halorussus salilacus]